MEQRLRLLHDWLPREAWSQRASARTMVTGGLRGASQPHVPSAMLPLLHEGLRQASRSPIGPPSRYRRDIVGWVIWKLLAPSNGLRTRTIRAFVPSGDESPRRVMAEFARLQSEMIACVRAGGRAANRSGDAAVAVRRAGDVQPLRSALTLIPRHQAAARRCRRSARRRARRRAVTARRISGPRLHSTARATSVHPRDPSSGREEQHTEDAHAEPAARIEARVQRVHEERKERVDVRAA